MNYATVITSSFSQGLWNAKRVYQLGNDVAALVERRFRQNTRKRMGIMRMMGGMGSVVGQIRRVGRIGPMRKPINGPQQVTAGWFNRGDSQRRMRPGKPGIKAVKAVPWGNRQISGCPHDCQSSIGAPHPIRSYIPSINNTFAFEIAGRARVRFNGVLSSSSHAARRRSIAFRTRRPTTCSACDNIRPMRVPCMAITTEARRTGKCFLLIRGVGPIDAVWG